MRESTIPRLFRAASECGSIFKARRRSSAAAALPPLCIASEACSRYVCSCDSSPLGFTAVSEDCVCAKAPCAIGIPKAIIAVRARIRSRIRQILIQ